jgi:quercetin dioxygenase-like cupin family protein
MQFDRSMPIARTVLSLGFLLAGAGSALAHDPAGAETVRPILRLSLPDVPGKQATMVTVSYEPGQASAPHLHPGSVFAYVLEGSVVSQLEGAEAKTYTQGQSWYEPPQAHHLVSRNASATQPAKLLVWLLGGENEPVKQALPR